MSGMTMREEPECIKKWKLEQEEMLKKKDADEELKKEELRVKAAQELADWYNQYEEQLAKTRKANKEQEAATAVPEVLKQGSTIALVKLGFYIDLANLDQS